MAENSEVMSNRDRMNARLKAKYADKAFDDDESMYAQINDDYDDYDKTVSGYKDRESKLADMFSSDPRSARFISDWSKGNDPALSLVRNYGMEIKDIIDDPDRQEEMAAANKEYLERVTKNKELEETYKTNLTQSCTELERLQNEEGMSDEDIDAAIEFLLGIINDGVVGKFSAESVKMALKALRHDDDVALAGNEGEVRGRNTKIEEKLRKPAQGDGTARLDGRNSTAPQAAVRNKSIFDLANEA
jgi:hypothetical protein